MLSALPAEMISQVIDLMHGRRFTWNFLLAAVSFPIVGVDFLRHFQLIVDPAAKMLVDKASLQSFATVSLLTAAASPSPAAARIRPLYPQSPVHSHWSTVTGHQSPVSGQRVRRRRWPRFQRLLPHRRRRWSGPLFPQSVISPGPVVCFFS